MQLKKSLRKKSLPTIVFLLAAIFLFCVSGAVFADTGQDVLTKNNDIRDENGTAIEFELIGEVYNTYLYVATIPQDATKIFVSNKELFYLTDGNYYTAYENGKDMNGTGPDLEYDSTTCTYTIPMDFALFRTTLDKLPDLKEYPDYTGDLQWNDSTSYFRFIILDATTGNTFDIVLQTESAVANIDEAKAAALKKAISDAEAVTAETHYIENDRYNGKAADTISSMDGSFYKKMQKALETAKGLFKNSDPSQNFIGSANDQNVEAATADLNAAYARLIPKAQVNATALYETVIVQPNPYSYLQKEDYTSYSWGLFEHSLNKAKDLFDLLFDENGNPTATNVGINQAMVDTALEELAAAKSNLSTNQALSRTKANYKELSALSSLLKDRKAEDYTPESWKAFNEARAAAEAYVKSNPAPSDKNLDGKRSREINSLLTPVFKGYYFDLASAKNEITVTARVIDNVGARHPAYGIQNHATATFDRTLSLSGENRNLQGVISSAHLDFSADLTGAIADNVEPQFFLYINGIFVGDSYNNRRFYESSYYADIPMATDESGNAIYKNVTLHDGDEVLIVRANRPLSNYYISKVYAEYVGIYENDLCTLRLNGGKETVIEVKEGESFDLLVEKTPGIATNYRGLYEPAESISFVYGEPAESPETVTRPTHATKETTDKDGKITTSIYAAGWYYFRAANLSADSYGSADTYGNPTAGKYPNLNAGDGIILHILPLSEEELEKAIHDYLDQTDALLAEYKKYEQELGTEHWKEVQSAYHVAKSKIIPATSIATAQAAIEEAEAQMKKIRTTAKAETNYKLNQLHNILHHLADPDQVKAGLFSKADVEAYLGMKEKYDALTPYQRTMLTENQQRKIDALIAAYGEDGSTLPDPIYSRFKLRIEGIDTEGTIKLRYYTLDAFRPNSTVTTVDYHIGETISIDYRFAQSVSVYLPIEGDDMEFLRDYSFTKLTMKGTSPDVVVSNPDGNLIAEQQYSNILYLRYDPEVPCDQEVVITYHNTRNPSFADKKAAAETEVRNTFFSYQKTDYSTENWNALNTAYAKGIAAIVAAETEEALSSAGEEALAAMAAVEKRGEDDLGTVHVSIHNDTYAEAPFTGEIAAADITLTPDTTMMYCILKTLEQNGFDWAGTGGNKYNIGYLGTISKDGKTLGEFDGGPNSGWMGSLNDWFTNEGFTMFSVENNKLRDGDVIEVDYTCALGEDIFAGTETNKDTSLRLLSFTNGTLSPAFQSDVTDYLLILDEGETTTTPTFSNNNRAFQSRCYLDEYTPSSGRWIRSGETVEVESGSILYIGVGEKQWPSMGSATKTLYTVTVLSANGADAVIKTIDDIGKFKHTDVVWLGKEVSNEYGYEIGTQYHRNQYNSYLRKAEKARTAYNALPEKDRQNVTNYDLLIEAEEKLRECGEVIRIKDTLYALYSADEINEVTAEWTELVNAYKNFSRAQIGLLTGEEIQKAEAIAHRLDQLNAAAVDVLIEAIGEVTTASGDQIRAAREGYDALQSSARELTKSDALFAAEEAYRQCLLAADAEAVAALIAAIGEVDYDAIVAIEDAREAYDALSDEAKALVANYELLPAAEEAYRVLKTDVPYIDVAEDDWFISAVRYVHANALMNGMGNNEFLPAGTLNRAMFVTILYRLSGEPEVNGVPVYTDVATDTWYTGAVLWATENNIVKGFEDNTFRPDDNISREQMATMLLRYATYMGYDVSQSVGLGTFMDAWKVGSWAEDAMEWAVAVGLLQGRSDKELAPGDHATRAEAAAIIQRFASICQ